MISGSVLRGDGAVVSGATVMVIDPAGSQVGRTVSDDHGRFSTDVTATGSLVLVVSAPHHEPRAVPVTLGASPAEVEVILGSMAVLSGRVRTSATGEPVVQATVAIADRAGQVVATTSTGADGSWDVGGLVDGVHTVIITAAGCDPIAETIDVAGDNGQVLNLEVHTVADLSGVVVDSGQGTDARPVVQSQVVLLDAAGQIVSSTTTDQNGRYLFPNLGDGDHTVIANGYAPVAETIAVAAGRVATHDFVLGAVD
ncbi:carboxypeptidase regulatory-like domain-containing protein [Gordonia sp. HY002]|uniref:MSCRAMM family protein n=1 Tax=Gordonia zhenghanii TaxID=2911516 RepID=UPI001EEFDB19|nr:carboxypeptidase-like regulatory domain-containing protein [Gordonia zhenghanii]MCF8572155.1 carboxypeptidase regulatory-like domain-containing protein [Gordonia zhenghanii]MCF8606358.1 carboxypeptidase regulatory-like domain-containing protein [Gordonia zhenghanii]